MAGQVKIINYNANGIYGDIITLQELLQRKEVDIAFVGETKLPLNFKNFRWTNPGYRTYENAGPTRLTGGLQS